ncbi:MAG: V-type ATP synthase subunit D [Candidatus Altiarchaeales archaeon]|nr:V-type ATP synthase subunit D [Candidatus Altiarchaeales archaeon]
MAERIEGVTPTRMQLITLKNKLKLARKGHRLLKEKRDSLMMEFMRLAREAGKVRQETFQQMQKARLLQRYSQAQMTSLGVSSNAVLGESNIYVELNHRNIVGVKIPSLTIPDFSRDVGGRGLSLKHTPPVLDVTAAEFEEALSKLLNLAETEGSLEALVDETRKTKRRVNALEYRRIPQLQASQKYVEMRLDELEREGFYRLKMIKKKKRDT